MAIYYENHGRENRPAIVLIHGFPFNQQLWDRQLELSASSRLILPDLPGFGKTPLEIEPEEMTIEYMADSVADLLGELNIQKATVVGHSMGGYVALALAERNPDLVGAVVLAASHPFADDETARAQRRNLIERVKDEGPQVVPAGMREKLFAPATAVERKPLVDGMYALMKMATSEALIAGLTAMAAREDRSHVLSSLDGDVAIFAGAEDRILPMEHLEKLAGEVPGAEFQVFKNSGHMLMLEEPDLFNERLEAFVAEALPDEKPYAGGSLPD